MNKTNFFAANGDRSNSAFGTITSTFPARQVQFALKKALLLTRLCLSAVISVQFSKVYKPGSRVIMLAHNADPDHGKYGDRLDRIINTGRPFVVEQDLSWIDGKSLMIHGAKNARSDDPTSDPISFRK